MNFSSGLQFRVIDGQKEKDRIIRLDGKELVIGRAQKGVRPGHGEVLFREPTVSRVHVNLSWKERKGGFMLTHKSGTNSTLVNGKPIKKILLAPGDRVQMGLLILELEEVPGGRQASGGTIGGGDTRGRSSMTEPILEALSKVERQHEEDRRRVKAENEQKQRQREIMASSEPAYEERESEVGSRSRRLDEALRAAPPRLEEERKKRRSGPTFGWQPPEERDEPKPTRRERVAEEEPPVTARPSPQPPRQVVYEDERSQERRTHPLSPAPQAQPAAVPSAAPSVNPAGSETGESTRRREAVYELVVVKGPDQGRRFPLKDMVMVLGQRLGDHDERDEQGVLLNDATLPAELGIFAWQGREGSYGLLASEGSMQIIEVDRISEGARRRLRVDSTSSILLKVADEIQVGLTTLRVQKIGEPIPMARSRVAAPAEVIPPSAKRQESKPVPLRNRGESTGSFRTAPPSKPERSVGDYPPGGPQGSPPPVEPPANDPAVPLWAQSTLVPGRNQDSGTTSSGMDPTPTRTKRPEDGEFLEWGNRPLSDFLFEVVAGPLRGSQVSMNRGDLVRPRRYNAGRPGSRNNDINLDDPEIPQEAFHLIGDEGRFSLCNECATGLLTVNRSPLKTGDRLVLMTGDLITLGKSQIRFLERDVVKLLSMHGLLAESGVTSDQDRTFPLNRQRLLVGRGKTCDVRLADLEVSRAHLGIAYSEGRFSIQHRSETNPTFLNGLSLLPGTVRTLKVGDRIRLSSLTVLRFVHRE